MIRDAKTQKDEELQQDAEALEESRAALEALEQHENELIMGVKYGTPNNYPNLTYGEAFDFFFGSPEWTAFEGTMTG